MNNSAGRLHKILSSARDKKIRDQPMIQAWKTVLGLPTETDDLIAMHKVGKVYTLPELISSQIQRFPDIDHELYLGWRKDLTAAFRVLRFDAPFHGLSDKLTDSLLINIKFCAHELNKRLPEKTLTPEALAELKNEVWELYNQVLRSDLGAPLDRYLLDRLYAIIEAIDDFEITGSVGLERVLNEVVGTIATTPEIAEASRKSQFGDKFWKAIGRIGFLLSIAKSAAELTEKIQNLQIKS